MNWLLFAKIFDWAIANAIPVYDIIKRLFAKSGGDPAAVTEQMFEDLKADMKPAAPPFSEL